MIRRVAAACVAVLLTAIGSPALACPLCYASIPLRVLRSYYLSAVLLTILPFAVVGSLVALGMHMARRAGNNGPAPDPDAEIAPDALEQQLTT